MEGRITSTLLSHKPKDESWPVAIVIGLLVALISLLCWRDADLFATLSASPSHVFAGREYWRAATTIAVHADLQHLLSNAIFLVFFGYLLYGYFGFWIYPVVMLVLGTATTFFSLLTYPAQVTVVGASGLVYVMMSFWMAMYAFVDRTVSFQKRLLRIVGVGLIVLIPTSAQPGVSYRTHAIGAAVGILTALAYFRIKKEQIRALETMEIEEDENGVRS